MAGQFGWCTTERTLLVHVKSVRMVVIPIAGVNEEEGESMSSWRQCCRKEERCCPEDHPRYGVLSEGLWWIVCSNPNGGHQVPWPWLGCRWTQMGRRVVLISLLILIPWKVETWFLAYKRRPAVYQCNISILKIKRTNVNAKQFKDMQTKIPFYEWEWMRKNKSEINITREFLHFIIFIPRLLPFHRHRPFSSVIFRFPVVLPLLFSRSSKPRSSALRNAQD